MATLEKRLARLIAQRKLCGGEACRKNRCKRCARGRRVTLLRTQTGEA